MKQQHGNLLDGLNGQDIFRRSESDGTHGTGSGGDQGGGMGEREGPQHERVLAARPNRPLSGIAVCNRHRVVR